MSFAYTFTKYTMHLHQPSILESWPEEEHMTKDNSQTMAFAEKVYLYFTCKEEL